MSVLEKSLLAHIDSMKDRTPFGLSGTLANPDKDGFYAATVGFDSCTGYALSRSPTHALAYALRELADAVLRETR